MNVALYVRVSTDEQREKESVQTQIEKLRRYCEQQKLEVFDLYNDDGVSGDKPMEKRPDGARLLRDAERRQFDTVLATRYDRVGRGKPSQTLMDIERIEGYGIPVDCIEQWVDLKDPNGILMRLVHIGVARGEWLTTAKRSKDGIDRLLPTGQFMGGIVPFGYRVEGYKRSARLVPSLEPIPGVGMSESEVVEFIYQSVAEQGRSCVWVADQLNELGVPPAYWRPVDENSRSRRTKTSAGIWRPTRIANLIHNSTYKGVYTFAKTSTTGREPVERPCTPIISPELWQKAQDALTRNMLFSAKNHKREYLLRGLVKCGCCGLTYVGTAWNGSKDGPLKVYYTCNGKIGYRGQYGAEGKRCPSKAISGTIEEVVWKDVLGFLRNPGDVLAQLAEQQKERVGEADRLRDEAAKVKKSLDGLDGERERASTLLIKGVLDERTYKKQADRINADEEQARKEVDRLLREALDADAAESRLASVGDLLSQLHSRLDEPLTFNLQRQLIETLVDTITVETVGEGEQKDKRAVVNIRYRFGPRECLSREPQGQGFMAATSISRAG